MDSSHAYTDTVNTWRWFMLQKTDCDFFCLLSTKQMVSTAAFGQLL